MYYKGSQPWNKYNVDGSFFKVEHTKLRLTTLGHLHWAIIDDLLAVSRCGMDSVRLNVPINSIIELKKLKFHTTEDKKRGECHVMHIGSNEKNCPGMKVHGQDVDSVSQAVYLEGCDLPGWVKCRSYKRQGV